MPDPKPSDITSRPPLVDLTPAETPGPSILYITRDDKLYLRSFSAVGARDGDIAGRLLHPDGIIREFQFHFAYGAGAPTVQVFTLAEGYLISVTVSVVTAATPDAFVFAELGLIRGRPADRRSVQLLTSGTLSLATPLGWPGGRQDRAGAGRGGLTLLSTADPAAGAEWTLTINANAGARIHSIRFQLVTDATVIDRFPRVEYLSPGTLFWRSHPNAAQTAGLTRDYNYALGTDFIDAAVANEQQNQLPDLILPPAAIVRSSTNGLQAGDNYGVAVLWTELWLER
jgi:hypothetical protein